MKLVVIIETTGFLRNKIYTYITIKVKLSCFCLKSKGN